MITTTLTFPTPDGSCTGWLTIPDQPGPHPVLVLAHGFGANHSMALATYERHFAAAGIATLAFDYRHLGESPGEPRQRLSLRRHRQDIDAAVDFAAAHPDLDAGRIALWGTSLGAMHTLLVASRRRDIAAVVVQCPIVSGPATVRRGGLAPLVRMTPAVVVDAARRCVGLSPRYVPIVGRPGEPAAVTTAGAFEGWHGTAGAGGYFENRVGASDIVAIAVTSAKRRARRISAPLLVCVSRRETLMDPRHAADVARAAPRGEAKYYDADHFEVYHPPMVDQLLADQTDFLRRHLDA